MMNEPKLDTARNEVPTFVLAGGGPAGRKAAEALWRHFPSRFVGLVWDPAGGEPPQLDGLRECELASAEALLCSGYGRIIQQVEIDRFSLGAFNAHPSLLPAYRGRHAIQWAIDEGESVLGVTVHRMTSVVDHGELLLTRSCRYGLNMSYPQISDHLAGMAAEMLIELILRLALPCPLPVLPIDARNNRWYRRRSLQDGQLDFRQSSARVLSRVRAGAPAYPASAQTGCGKGVRITGYIAGDIPGQVLVSTPDGCLIATGDGVVWLVPDVPLCVGEVLK